mgnify:FL=1
MNYWLETNSSFYSREGKYLICPFHSNYVRNHPSYKIMLEPKKGDLVFHYFVYLSAKEVNIIKSYSRIVDSFYEVTAQDELCQYSPPYRKIELESNTQFNTRVTHNMLKEKRGDIELICKIFNKSRTPFDKNFKFKQMYLSRVPSELADIIGILSETKID